MTIRRSSDKKNETGSSNIAAGRDTPAGSQPTTSSTSITELPEMHAQVEDISSGFVLIPSPAHTVSNKFDQVNSRARDHTADRSNGPLGLTVIHEPVLDRVADIIFVHGLGGSSHGTWTDGHDPQKFWPQKWLPVEPALSQTRILTFGYDSRFSVGAMGIQDWAKSLLFELKFARDSHLQSLGLGKVGYLCQSIRRQS